MATAPSMPPAGFDDLPSEKKLEYVQNLWERIAKHPEDLRSPEWHLEIVEQRLAAMEHDGNPGRPWTEVREDLLTRLRTVRR
ncbi:MAG TPA: addiction module protein [Polyangiales bacterium]